MLMPQSMLPYDGDVLYYGQVLPQLDADFYFEQLSKSIPWQHDEAIIYGKRITTSRKVAWYGDQPYAYTYSGVVRHAIPWTSGLLILKMIIQKISNETYNSCLLNLYHTGAEGMSWHSDNEAVLKENGAIASLSLGATRKFCFKHKQSKEKVELLLHHGDLLVMSGTTQVYWAHALPKTKKIIDPRINLTFRCMNEKIIVL